MGLYIGKVDRRWLSRVLLIMLADIIGIMGSYLLALWARFDFHFTDIPQEFVDGYLHTIWWWVPVCLAVFWLCNLYNSIWRFVSVDALMRIILAYVLLGGLSFACVALFGVHMPRSYYVWGLFFSFFCTSGIRFFYRGMRYLRNRAPLARKGAENVMIIGAGQAGRQLIREYAVSSHLNSRVACIIDDNPAKRGRILEGVRVRGCAAGHSPGRQAIRYRQDRVRHSVASGCRKAGDPQYMQHHRLPDPGGAGHVSAGQR